MIQTFLLKTKKEALTVRFGGGSAVIGVLSLGKDGALLSVDLTAASADFNCDRDILSLKEPLSHQD